MEIIKQTTINQPNEEWIGECRNCKSIAKANRNELTNFTAGNYRNDFEDFSWEVCPVCEAEPHTSGYGGMIFYKLSSRSGQKSLSKTKKEV